MRRVGVIICLLGHLSDRQMNVGVLLTSDVGVLRTQLVVGCWDASQPAGEWYGRVGGLPRRMSYWFHQPSGCCIQCEESRRRLLNCRKRRGDRVNDSTSIKPAFLRQRRCSRGPAGVVGCRGRAAACEDECPAGDTSWPGHLLARPAVRGLHQRGDRSLR